MHEDMHLFISELPEPVPPSRLSRTVMATIARAADAAPPASIRRRRSGVPTASAAVIAALALTTAPWVAAGWSADFLSPRIGAALALIPAQPDAALPIAIGLLIYVLGVVRPLQVRR